ncbi:hypothetical protein [Asticcacaulis sp. AC460]|uniref:hypothetical protein n=1 Tax=Asticcacaulis sp. AC460 TaxID=1282360 RepID=UPI001F470530|nr:hypothetical protein [Asticcacaulis sp. AC460]
MPVFITIPARGDDIFSAIPPTTIHARDQMLGGTLELPAGFQPNPKPLTELGWVLLPHRDPTVKTESALALGGLMTDTAQFSGI